MSPGDEISIREKSRTKKFILEAIEQSATQPRPAWLEFDPAKSTGKMTTAPERTDLPFDLHENAIVEFYSQKL